MFPDLPSAAWYSSQVTSGKRFPIRSFCMTRPKARSKFPAHIPEGHLLLQWFAIRHPFRVRYVFCFFGLQFFHLLECFRAVHQTHSWYGLS
jgi:hypothetical protein